MIKINRSKLLIGAAAMALAIPFAASSASAASLCTMNGPLLDAGGVDATVSGLPYSPRTTCFQGVLAGCHADTDYASGNMIAVHKTQGVLDNDGAVHWQSYTVQANDHGAVRGRHSQQGRNEDYGIAMKTTFKDVYFTSSPGMFGKY